MSTVFAFVQARMSSRRFPGKVLAPFRGRPLIRHVLEAMEQSLPTVGVVVATSVESSDDPLATYLETSGVTVFRGPLADVFQRFRLCVAKHSCDWILRLSADSPLLDPRVLRTVASYADRVDVDLVTTIFPRTFPRGQNAELIRVNTFLAIDARELSSVDREHVTPFYYRYPERFRIVNVESGRPELSELSLAVDTVEDLERLDRLTEAEIRECSVGALTPTRS